jgi:hypothetical protein
MSTANERERSDIEDLLPWHAAGTLDPRDTRRVEAALANDPELARRYELVREELSQTVYLNETLGAPSPRAMEALFAKIDAEPVRRPMVSMNLGARIGEFFAGIVLKEKSAGSYEIASAPTNVAGDGAYALIRFQPQANAADITKFLETNELSIAGGPSAGGLYRVRIAATKLPKTDLDRIVKTLQEDKVVGFIATTE